MLDKMNLLTFVHLKKIVYFKNLVKCVIPSKINILFVHLQTLHSQKYTLINNKKDILILSDIELVCY